MSTTDRCEILGSDKPRIAVRDIPCDTCGRLFGQTEHERKRNLKTGPQCARAHRMVRNPLKTKKEKGPRNRLEVVLPKTLKPSYDKKRGEWYMKVRVRKRGTDEKLTADKVYLGLTLEAPAEQVKNAYTAAYSRMEMNGASKHTAEALKKKRKRIKNIVRCVKSWKQGRDRDLGVRRHVIQKVVFKVHLPDPKVDGKKHYIGRYDTRAEARKARDEAYRNLKQEHVPCAVCGRLPVVRRGILTHFAADCANKVQMPTGIRPLLQAKLWNLVFSTGDVHDAGKLVHEDLFYMGYMYKSTKGFRYYARDDVHYDFTLAKKHVKKRPVEDVGFE